MGLKPLEFSDCLLDSPYFRESIHDHEKELDQANDAIKSLIKESRNLIKALENLSRAQFSFTAMLENFKLRYIGEVETEDKLEYEDAFLSFAQIFQKVEEERVRMLDHANIQLIEPLDKFRKEQIGRAKDEKRKFDRETERVCGLLESHLKLSPKKKDTALQEADVQLEHELRNFREMSLDYVTKLQEVNEKKKFELVEIILSYMYGQATFYHNGHEVFQDHKSYLTDLQFKLQTTRDRYDITKDAADDLKNKTKRRFTNGELHKGRYAREGYLLVYDKRKSVLSAQWVKHYCFYTKENKILTMVPHNQTNVKLVANTDTLVVTSCVRKITETSDRRFLFDITGQVRSQPITLQAMSEEDRKQWLEVMEGREPIYVDSSELVNQAEGITRISDVGVQFVTKCMEAVETRGITDQGIYRIAGVSSKFNKLLNTGIDPKNIEKLDLISENSPWDIKTITSAMKQYFRTLSEPIFTFKHHHEFLNAIKLDTHAKKMEKLKELVKLLPEVNFKILHRLMYHLKLVASHSKDNLMQESNLSVVLGPTLMRPKEETMAAIMSIKFQSMVIENIIKEYDQIFGEGPPPDFKGNGNNNDVPVSPTSPKFIAKSSNPERTPSTKHRAPPPARPSVLPKKISDPDNRNINVIQQKPALADRPSNGTANKEGARFAVGAKFAETVPPFTGISEESSNVPRRSESYATAMHKVANTAQSEQRVPPPIIKPTAAPPKVPKRNEWKVRALYDCVAENTAELSFNKDAIITNVRASTEEGWLIGMLNGKTGLVPENYCAKIG